MRIVGLGYGTWSRDEQEFMAMRDLLIAMRENGVIQIGPRKVIQIAAFMTKIEAEILRCES